MVEVPTGSLVGLCALVLVLGIIMGRSSKFMTRAGALQARLHARTGDQQMANDQRVQVVTLLDGATGTAHKYPVVTEDRRVSELLASGDDVAELLAADDEHLWSQSAQEAREPSWIRER